LAANENVASPVLTVPAGPSVMSTSGCAVGENPMSSACSVVRSSSKYSIRRIVAAPSSVVTTSGTQDVASGTDVLLTMVPAAS
jgi:hypothetical protein